MTKATAKKPKYRVRLIFLYIGSFIVSIAPLLTVLILNWDKYAKTPSDTVKLCLGGIICLIFIFMKVVGKLHMPSRIVFFGIVFIMAYLLQALLYDLILLSGMALIGEVIDVICFQHLIKVTKENILVGKTASETSKQVEEVIKSYFGRV